VRSVDIAPGSGFCGAPGEGDADGAGEAVGDGVGEADVGVGVGLGFFLAFSSAADVTSWLLFFLVVDVFDVFGEADE